MSDLKPGDIIDISIKGARVVNVVGSVLTFSTMVGGRPTEHEVYCGASFHVTAERVAPAEWPPRAGDLWRDKHDELWFIHECPTDKTRPLMGRTTGGARWTDEAFALIEDNAPLTLVHREGGAR